MIREKYCPSLAPLVTWQGPPHWICSSHRHEHFQQDFYSSTCLSNLPSEALGQPVGREANFNLLQIVEENRE